ncbi:DinB family protein [Acidicapsa dinghuensis]|uniref:DinB family protein n=1 Tax=Acidicapsa dinghuensis TaxID=2218256 RepID=A0ABW1EK40_9BACT|nr:DinB family protein [Acidicapsa dinghuensis]
MDLKQFFLEKLEREIAVTRKAIERVPEGKNDWKPHPRSMELGYLAALVAEMLGWIAFMVERDSLDLGDPASEGFKTRARESKAELLEALDKGVARSRAALEATTEEHLKKNWQFKMGGQVISDLPRYVMLTDAVFSHLAHHRGQLTVYLRLNEEKVPAMYGPSADEFH